ncbi:hypothetical protein BAL199_00130 [alpha proteobacterium BAL199]|nr:hypothetical protein BAL199_00130 [alpha proteobacterium BAL199]
MQIRLPGSRILIFGVKHFFCGNVVFYIVFINFERVAAMTVT